MAEAIPQLLQGTLSPIAETRKAAEKQLLNMERQAGFSVALLNLLENTNVDVGTQTAAALYFKNIVRKYWSSEEFNTKENAAIIPEGDRQNIKAHLLSLMCQVRPVIQRVLSEAIRIIGESDFPEKWQNLLPDLTQKLGASQDFTIVIGLLETANTLFKMFRDIVGTNELLLKLKYCLEQFQEPLLQFYKRCNSMIKETSPQDTKKLGQLFQAMRLLTRIYYSLNWQDIPEYFEDHIKEWMEEFHTLLEYSNPALVNEEDDEKPGPVELVQTAIVGNVKLYLGKYEEQFQPYIQTFTLSVWNLLNKTPTDARYDDLVVVSLKFLSTLVGNVRLKSLFSQGDSLQGIVEKIVLPNLALREVDVERFEDNPMEFIRRDIEGSDSDTRRRGGVDLIRAMCRNFEAETTKLCEGIMGNLVQQYQSNPGNNWDRMDTTIALMLALSIRRYSQMGGVTEVNPNVNVEGFFQQFILPVLMDQDVNSQPIIKASVIKFFTTFRNQMPKNMVVNVLPGLVNLLGARSFVVHTYAAQAIERIFMIKDPEATAQGRTAYLYGAAELEPILERGVVGLFAILESFEGGVENEYVAKALMRVLSKAPAAKLTGAVSTLFGKLQVILTRICKNPQNPRFIHFLFESLGALIRGSCTTNPALTEQFENQLMPIFQQVLAEDIGELTSYVFQILALMLELRPGTASPGYLSLFQVLLRAEVWENRGNIPALVRLLEAYLRKAAAETVGKDPKQLEQLLGVFQKLLSKKSTCEMSFRLLIGIVEFLPAESYGKHLPTIFQLILTQLQHLLSAGQGAGKGFARSLVLFLSVLVGKHGAQPVEQALNGIQPNLFPQILREVWISSVEGIQSNVDRKSCVIALTRILVEVPSIQTGQLASECWANAFVACLIILETPPAKNDLESHEESLVHMAESGYSSTFSKLVYAQTEVRDSFKDIQDPKIFLAQTISRASAQQPGVYSRLVQESLQSKPNMQTKFQQYCQAAGVNIN